MNLSRRTHGKPSTYTSGCRCADCREAWRLYAQTNHRHRAHRMARDRLATWVRVNHPDVYRRIVDDAHAELTGEATA